MEQRTTEEFNVEYQRWRKLAEKSLSPGYQPIGPNDAVKARIRALTQRDEDWMIDFIKIVPDDVPALWMTTVSNQYAVRSHSLSTHPPTMELLWDTLVNGFIDERHDEPGFPTTIRVFPPSDSRWPLLQPHLQDVDVMVSHEERFYVDGWPELLSDIHEKWMRQHGERSQ